MCTTPYRSTPLCLLALLDVGLLVISVSIEPTKRSCRCVYVTLGGEGVNRTGETQTWPYGMLSTQQQKQQKRQRQRQQLWTPKNLFLLLVFHLKDERYGLGQNTLHSPRHTARSTLACQPECISAYAVLSSTMDHSQHLTLHRKRKSIARRRICLGHINLEDPRSRTLLITVPAHHFQSGLGATFSLLSLAVTPSLDGSSWQSAQQMSQQRGFHPTLRLCLLQQSCRGIISYLFAPNIPLRGHE